MAEKATVSITDQQEAFARRLVDEGRFASLSDVVQHGLELVREETEWSAEDRKALSELLAKRLDGDFITKEQSDREIDDMIAEKKAALGL